MNYDYPTFLSNLFDFWFNNEVENDETFEIELFNPTKSTVKAVITLDGKTVTPNGLIIRNGERVYLDCFVNSRKKFKFKTYRVEDSEEVRDAISDNGELKVEFFREYVPIAWYINNYPQPWTNNYPHPWTNYDGTIEINGKQSITYNKAFYNTNLVSCSVNGTIETGKTEEGEDSNTKFKSVAMDFEAFAFKTVKLKLLPISEKPTFSTDLKSKKKITNKVDEIFNKLTILHELKECKIIDNDEFEDFKERPLSDIETISDNLHKIQDLLEMNLIEKDEYNSLRSEIVS